MTWGDGLALYLLVGCMLELVKFVASHRTWSIMLEEELNLMPDQRLAERIRRNPIAFEVGFRAMGVVIWPAELVRRLWIRNGR